MAGLQQSRNVRLLADQLGAILSQRLAAEGSSIVRAPSSRFLLRLESLEERSDFAEAIAAGAPAAVSLP